LTAAAVRLSLQSHRLRRRRLLLLLLLLLQCPPI
jgi:hypothetical protein